MRSARSSGFLRPAKTIFVPAKRDQNRRYQGKTFSQYATRNVIETARASSALESHDWPLRRTNLIRDVGVLT